VLATRVSEVAAIGSHSHPAGENGVLEAIPLFRGATKVYGWSDHDDPCRPSDIAASVRLYRDDASFKDARGATLTVYALMITGDYLGDSIFLVAEPEVAHAEYRRAMASVDHGCHCIDFA